MKEQTCFSCPLRGLSEGVAEGVLPSLQRWELSEGEWALSRASRTAGQTRKSLRQIAEPEKQATRGRRREPTSEQSRPAGMELDCSCTLPLQLFIFKWLHLKHKHK